MLEGAYHWLQINQGSYLRFNYTMVASVTPGDDQRYVVLIRWQGREHQGRVASIAQGVRHIERWVAARKDFPTRRGGGR